ncbi:MAG: hypothetical protein ACD_10C00395G0002 [uncultured bacterium]|nr:MAG: hypothetical protein ACD_10C00395G0002 [uncultured bacterium]
MRANSATSTIERCTVSFTALASSETASAKRAMVFFISRSRASGVACAIMSQSSFEKLERTRSRSSCVTGFLIRPAGNFRIVETMSGGKPH